MATRQTLKRAAKNVAPVVVDEDEPEVKKGRGRRASKKEEDGVKQIPTTKKGKKATTDMEAEPTDDGEAKVNGTKRGRGRGKKNEENNVKNEVDDDTQQSKPSAASSRRGRKKAVDIKEEEEEDDTQQPASSKQTKDQIKKEVDEEEESDTSKPSSSNNKKGKKSKAAKNTSKKNGEEPSTSPKNPGGKKTKAQGKKSGTPSKGKENTDSNNIPLKSVQKSGIDRVMVVKGRAAVDALCPVATQSHVYEEDDDVWDCMLNQTNIQFNNNKYYLIQLLKDDTRGSYSVWMRWGRVGANGQNSLQPCASDLNKAKKIFMKKFSDKTKNDWDMRDMFEKVPGKYDLLFMDYSKGQDTPDAAVATKKLEEQQKLKCKLEARVRELIELICDVRTMEETVVEMKYDAKKAPLGKLTTEQIRAGYLALKQIDDLVQKGSVSNKDLLQACNDFYTRIPHYFGMKVPPLIRTKGEIREKMALLEALGDIQAALSVLEQPGDSNLHPADQQYSSLKCDLTTLKKESTDFKVLDKYLQTTHAKTHNMYTLELIEAFACHKESEHQRFRDVGNRQLLWHGSRLSNWAGILSTGLRIAPPEAPSTGYMFGKGIYFADMASKSANYCWATSRSNVGFLLLCDVSLGKTNDLFHADYNAARLPKDCNSVKGCGRTAPTTKNFTKLSDGTVVPMGPGIQATGGNTQGYSLLYNEYIVYDPAQVLTRYLLKVKFNFK